MKPLDKGYVVDVCVELGFYESGDMNPDTCKNEHHEFATHDKALAAARRLLPRDKFGEVAVMPFVRDKYGIDYDWDNREIVYK